MELPPRIMLSNPGTGPHVQQTARALWEAGMLDRYATGFAYQPDSSLGKFLRALVPPADLQRRRVSEIPEQFLDTHPFPEILRSFASRFLGPVMTHRVWRWAEFDFDRFAARRLGVTASAVYCYEHAALETFRRARDLGLKTIYEMPVPFHATVSKILDHEWSLFPEVMTPVSQRVRAESEARNRRKEEELSLADLIVCNSRFTERSLVVDGGVNPDRIVRVPLGMPEVNEGHPREESGGGLRFLYAGTLSVRKGFHYLINAWKRLSSGTDASLVCLGRTDVPSELLNGASRLTVSPTVPRERLYEEYRSSDLLLFPTLCDGFGMVITEALAQGLPVLTTENAGASDFIEDGVNGFIVPVRDPEAILHKLEWCLAHPGRLRSMRAACVSTARSWQWADYRKGLSEQLRERLKAA